MAVERMLTPIAAVRSEMEQMGGQFLAALPAHISVDKFKRTLMTGIQNNPELLECDRRSLWNAVMKAAQDGLLPDGREGALIVRKNRKAETKEVTWQPMVAGIRKKARNSGELATWDVHAVYENDQFDYELGDESFIRHRPALNKRGELVGAYSVATLKDGFKSRDVMGIDEIYEIRDRYSDGWRAYKNGWIKSTPWADSPGEMAKKTVARRHAKLLPMSTDLERVLRRGEDDDPDAPSNVATLPTPAARRLTLQDSIDHLAGADPEQDNGPTPEPEQEPVKRGRGRPVGSTKKAKAEAAKPLPDEVEDGEVIEGTASQTAEPTQERRQQAAPERAGNGNGNGGKGTSAPAQERRATAQPSAEEAFPGDSPPPGQFHDDELDDGDEQINPKHPDYRLGSNQFRLGIKRADKAIRDDPSRLANWMAGWARAQEEADEGQDQR